MQHPDHPGIYWFTDAKTKKKKLLKVIGNSIQRNQIELQVYSEELKNYICIHELNGEWVEAKTIKDLKGQW